MSDVVPTSLIDAVLERRGWQKVEGGDRASLWANPEAIGSPQMYVPHGVHQGGFEWSDMARRIAEVAGVTATAIETEIEMGRYDVVRVRVPEARGGTVPLEAGSTLVAATRVMLRAAATTARRPQQRIKSYSKLGDEVVRGARLAHTERGSMIFPVLLLLDEPPADKAEPLDGFDSITPESDQRRVTRTLAEALSLYNRTVIQKAVEPKAVDMGPLIAAGGSREMFRQVQQVLRDPELGVLDISFAWAAVEQPRGQAVERVGISSDAIDLVDRTVQLLSKMEPRPRSIVTGPIYTISHATDGPVHIAIQTAGLNGHLQKVELTVSADRRSDLHKWMDAGITVTASGRIQTQPGMPARLLDVDGPVPLDETIFQGE